ncbi:N-acetyltransferase [Cohnella sp. WQ 127256]|uniref:GNAT family N-acetyltransferase n=1 Tax=Cohnella sp. WQ 127256 TaxID=2938790 RepID=UPI0021175D27|nr:GNAT family N-acetyltransferase [Cohnella sp. WQ 127256]
MIRWRQPRDDNGIVELIRTQLVPISPWQHPGDSKLRNEITQRLRRGATLVVADSRRRSPIAFLHMEFHNKTVLIDLLAVHSRYQNKHWGSELMQRAEKYARKKGYTMSHVFVDEDNIRALKFYLRLGYNILQSIPPLKVIELTKSLAPYSPYEGEA